MKKAVITGCTGCIGVALINELVSNGVEEKPRDYVLSELSGEFMCQDC